MKASEHRMGVYKAIEGIIGRELTPVEHADLKDKMQAYVAEHGMNAAQSVLGPREYIYTCRKCKGQASAKGKQERKDVGGVGIQPKKKSNV